MRVCLVSQQYAPILGGIARFTADLARGLADAGHEVHVMSAQGQTSTVKMEDGVWVHRFPVAPFPIEELRNEYAGEELLRIGSVYREVITVHRRTPFDIVSSPIWLAEGLLIALDASIVSVLSLHTGTKTLMALDPLERASAVNEKRVELEAKCVRAHRYTHANSEASLSNTIKQYGPVNGPFIIHHGTPDYRSRFTRRRTNDGRVRILIVGRLDIRKGADLLLEILPPVLMRFPEVECSVVGPASPISTLSGKTLPQAFAEKAPGASWHERVEFVGAVSDQNLRQSYADADIFLFPSRYESFGLPLIEAMSFGLPVVACKTGGVSEILVDGQNGLTAEIGDSRALIEALSLLIIDPSMRLAYGNASRSRYISQFSAARSISQTIETYSGIAARERSRLKTDSCTGLVSKFALVIESVTACRGPVAMAVASRLATPPEEIAEAASKHFWFHSIDFGNGVVTKGIKSASELAAEEAAILGRVDLTGRTVADVGAWNGFFSFRAKGRGAGRVLAIDSYCWASPQYRGRESFEFARETLQLEIDTLEMDISDLEPAELGTFDVVLYLGVFYHRYDPIDALAKVAALARHVLIVETHIDLQDVDRPAMVFYPGGELAGDPTNWWGPNEKCIIELLRGHGFQDIEVMPHPNIDSRAVFHAWRTSELKVIPERPAQSPTAIPPPQAADQRRLRVLINMMLRRLKRLTS